MIRTTRDPLSARFGFISMTCLFAAITLLFASAIEATEAESATTVEREKSSMEGDRTSPALPTPSTFPIQLVLDDSTAEGAFGFSGGTARQFLWFNQFVSPGAFELEEIWVLFPAGSDVPLGGSIELAVFLDPDGDPSNGATLLASFDETIQAVDGTTFSIYPLPTPVSIDGSGDVLIGVVNRYFNTGVDLPPTLPAATDTTASQNLSYFALWPGDAADPPDLSSASSIALLSGAASANFMVRGFGTVPSTVAIPTTSTLGLILLVALLGLWGASRLRRSAAA